MVLFDLSTLRRMAADETIRGMFFLTQSTDLNLHSHVVLTSRGPWPRIGKGLAHARLQSLVGPASGKEHHDLSVLRRAAVSTGEKAR
jgi:hypothetical protein